MVLAIIQLIIGVLTIIILLGITRSLHMIGEGRKLSPEEKILKEFQSDPFMDDVMEYALEKGLQPVIRPGANSNQTLFFHDETDHSEYAITELHTVSAPRNSATYKKAFNTIKERIDIFLEQRTTIIKEIRERANAKA